MNTTLQRVIEHFGSQTAVAKELGLTHQAVQQWKYVPPKWALDIERKTSGKISAMEILQARESA